MKNPAARESKSDFNVFAQGGGIMSSYDFEIFSSAQHGAKNDHKIKKERKARGWMMLNDVTLKDMEES